MLSQFYRGPGEGVGQKVYSSLPICWLEADNLLDSSVRADWARQQFIPSDQQIQRARKDGGGRVELYMSVR